MAEVANRMQFENAFGRELSLLTSRQKERLVSLLGEPPRLSNVPASFWAEAKREREEALLAFLYLVFIANARQHGSTSPEAAAMAYARNEAAQAAKDTTDGIRQRISDIAKARQATPSQAPLDDEIEAAFPKPETVSAVATTQASSTGAEWSVKDQGLGSPDDYWQTEQDARVCPICSPLNKRKRDAWARKFPMGPPAHPNCRCYIVYANVPAMQPVNVFDLQLPR